ncbi:HNH endonuclease [Enterobacter hormaechei]|nr:HNH endonuclease [Enterobacter hormaechei]
MTLTQNRLKEVLRYDPSTGVFYWLNPTAYCMHPGDVAGFVDYTGYAYIKVDKVKYSAHRLAWIYVYGHSPIEQIDHINNVRSDNRIVNLRLATRSQNMMNQPARKGSISGVKGVSWDKKMQSWRARCQANGERINIGWFDSIEEAAESLRVYRQQYHGEFANHGDHYDNRI